MKSLVRKSLTKKFLFFHTENNIKFKVGFSPSKKTFLFASMVARQK